MRYLYLALISLSVVSRAYSGDADGAIALPTGAQSEITAAVIDSDGEALLMVVDRSKQETTAVRILPNEKVELYSIQEVVTERVEWLIGGNFAMVWSSPKSTSLVFGIFRLTGKSMQPVWFSGDVKALNGGAICAAAVSPSGKEYAAVHISNKGPAVVFGAIANASDYTSTPLTTGDGRRETEIARCARTDIRIVPVRGELFVVALYDGELKVVDTDGAVRSVKRAPTGAVHLASTPFDKRPLHLWSYLEAPLWILSETVAVRVRLRRDDSVDGGLEVRTEHEAYLHRGDKFLPTADVPVVLRSHADGRRYAYGDDFLPLRRPRMTTTVVVSRYTVPYLEFPLGARSDTVIRHSKNRK